MSILTQRQGIQATIKATLAAVPGVENVYDAMQRVQSMQDLIDVFEAAQGAELQYWRIARISGNIRTNETDPRQVVIRSQLDFEHTFEIDFKFAWRDNVSEERFHDLIDTVLDAFKDKRSLGGYTTERPLTLHGEIQSGIVNTIYFHMARFRVTVVAQENGLTPT